MTFYKSRLPYQFIKDYQHGAYIPQGEGQPPALAPVYHITDETLCKVITYHPLLMGWDTWDKYITPATGWFIVCGVVAEMNNDIYYPLQFLD